MINQCIISKKSIISMALQIFSHAPQQNPSGHFAGIENITHNEIYTF
jgi:hypothetical protein